MSNVLRRPQSSAESSVASAFRCRSSSRSEHYRKLADALPQCFERHVDRSLFLSNVRKACILHFFGSRFEAFAAHGIHRKEGECLRKRYAVRSGMQKFNVCIHFPEYGSESYSSERALSNRPFNEQCRSSRQRQALNDTNELLIIDCENGFLLMGNTDSRRSVALARLVDLLRHSNQDSKPALKQSTLPKCFRPRCLSAWLDLDTCACKYGQRNHHERGCCSFR